MVRRAWVATLSALILTLSLPHTLAAEAEGAFTTRGSITFPPESSATASPLGVFLRDTAHLGAIHATVPQATVYEFSATFYGPEGGLIPTLQVGPTRRASWPLTNLSLTLHPDGEHGGFLGFYPAPGARLTATGQFEIESGTPGTFGHPATTGEEPDSVFYSKQIAGAHFLVSGVATLEQTGFGAMKIRGPDVVLSAERNVSTHKTGTTRDGAAETISWLYIRFDAPATVTLNDVRFEAATADETATWDGALWFTPTGGDLRTADRAYSPAGRSAELDGAFTATLVPHQGGAQMRVTGDLRTTTLRASTIAPVPGPAAGGSLLPWFVFGAALLGGGSAGLVFAHRHRNKPTPRSTAPAAAPPVTATKPRTVEAPRVPPIVPPRAVDELADLAQRRNLADLLVAASSPVLDTSPAAIQAFAEGAELAEALQDWRAAYTLIRAARIGAPKNPDFAFKEGSFLYFLGDYRRAYGAFNDATRLRPMWGEPHLWAALCLARYDVIEQVEQHLEEGLERQPDLLPEIEKSEHFRALHGSPRFEAALGQARARLPKPETDERPGA